MSEKKKKSQKKLLKYLEAYFFDPNYQPITPKECVKDLEINKSSFDHALNSLLEEEKVEIIKGKIVPILKNDPLIASGTLRVHQRGFGFLIPDQRERFPQDIFIPKHLTLGAVDGDQVEVEIDQEKHSEKGPEGKVLHILRRGRSHVGGTIVAKNEHAFFAHVPLLGPSQTMKILPSSDRELSIGDRIVIKVLNWGSNKNECSGEVSAFVGHISDPSRDVQAAVEEFDLHDAFPNEVLKEVKAFGGQVKPKDMRGREDLRELECFTIDPDTAKDFDDALSLSKDEKGHFHLGVHIADVSHYVKPGTALDQEAKSRCNSVYFPGTVLPMLPHELSSHLCSLKPNVNRLTFSVFVTFDSQGTLIDYRIAKSVIRSCKRFTYREAKAVLDGKQKSKYKKTLELMKELCHRLKRKRAERGSIEFALPDLEISINAQGIPQKMTLVEYDITHQLVEEFMLKANEIVATHLARQDKPLTYRIHQEPSDENIKEFTTLATALGFRLPHQPSAQELQNMFDKARESPFGQFLATAFIRSMRLAQYSTQNIGHYGLGLEYYTHFTSPIRRYVDLIVHRVLCEEIQPKDNLEQIALECSERERLSAKAETSVILLKKLRLLHSLYQQDPDFSYQAVITSIKPYGFAFEIVDFLLDGFLPLSAIEEDYFIYEEKARRLRGANTGKIFAIGNTVTVTIESLNLITQEVKWQLVSPKKHKKHKKRNKGQ